MRKIKITNIQTDIIPPSFYHVSIAWRYGTVGLFRVANPSAEVDQNGILSIPVEISFDPNIKTKIQIRTTYTDCNSIPYYQTYDL